MRRTQKGPATRGVADDRARFAAMFDEFAPRVYAYAHRQCGPAAAQDIVSDTFLVAWRRRSDVPDQPLPWLLVVARNTLANRRRHEVRQDRLVDAVAHLESIAGPGAGADQDVIERDTLLAALAQLTAVEREALLLVSWDGLSAAEAARVAGCSGRALEVRLSRARTRLVRAADLPPGRTSRRNPTNEIAGDRRD